MGVLAGLLLEEAHAVEHNFERVTCLHVPALSFSEFPESRTKLSSRELQEAEMDIGAFEVVVIERQKVLDYLLSPIHHVGQYKAEFFRSLGYHQLLWRVLERDIRNLLQGELLHAGQSLHGTKYTLKGTLTGPNGRSARILTVWIVQPAQNVLRFVTAYPED